MGSSEGWELELDARRSVERSGFAQASKPEDPDDVEALTELPQIYEIAGRRMDARPIVRGTISGAPAISTTTRPVPSSARWVTCASVETPSGGCGVVARSRPCTASGR